MKTLYSLAFVCLLAFTGCATPYYAIGTPESEFVAKSHAKMVSMDAGSSVYMISVHKMSAYEHIFYYFADGKLFQVDHGVRRPDVVIDQTVHNQ